MIKHAVTKLPVLDLIKQRWSARSFSPKAITTENMHTILEAQAGLQVQITNSPGNFDMH